MAILLVDLGNTCLKYSLLGDIHQPVSKIECLWGLSFDEALRAMRAAMPESLTRVIISCVGQATQLAALQAEFLSIKGCDVSVAEVENNWQGFALGYEKASALGVDRWLAMLAVRQKLAPSQIGLLADCGTAVTVEGVAQDHHLGGLIAPGLGLMAKALNRDTADLPGVDHQKLGGQTWAHSTETAIASGCVAAVLGLLQRQKLLLEAQASLPVVAYLTGGDSVNLRDHLVGWVVDNTLVLEGLRLWARDSV